MICRGLSAARMTSTPAHRQATKNRTINTHDVCVLRVFAAIRLFIFERLDEGAAYGGLGGPQSCDECGCEERGNEARGDRHGKRVIEAHAGDVAMDDLQDVVQIQRAERK